METIIRLSDKVRYGESTPAWYKLSFIEPNFIVISVHKSVVSWFSELNQSNFLFSSSYEKDLGLDKFVPPNETIWGFDDSIQTKQAIDTNWVDYVVAVPILDYSKEKKFKSVSSSLLILLAALQSFPKFSDNEVLSLCPQLVLVELYTGPTGNSDRGVNAYYSPTLVNWLYQESVSNETIFREISIAMDKVASHLKSDQVDNAEPNLPYSYLNYDVRLMHEIYITLEIGIHVCLSAYSSYYNPEKDRLIGYSVSTQNADKITDQLILLAGLCKMCSLAEKWFSENSVQSIIEDKINICHF
jgi:hypothetical protein